MHRSMKSLVCGCEVLADGKLSKTLTEKSEVLVRIRKQVLRS